jgi:hypothetical protein
MTAQDVLSSWALKASIGFLFFTTLLYICGPKAGSLLISCTIILGSWLLHRWGGKTDSRTTGFSLVTGGGRALGEQTSAEIDASLRGLPPPTAPEAGRAEEVLGAVKAAGRVLGSAPPPAGGPTNALLAQLAQEREARQRQGAQAAAAAAAAAAQPT